MEITPNLIDELEEMSALSLNDEQKEQMAVEISQMLGFMEQIKDVSVENGTNSDNVISIDDFARDDDVQKSADIDLVLKNAKNVSDNFFAVPKVVD